MSRQELTFARDMTFHIARRKFGRNIPATDIDFLEYDHRKPILLWEAKSERSGWRSGIRTDSMEAQWNLANQADVPYRVMEHNDDWSEITVCEIESWDGRCPVIASELPMTLPEFVSWLYEIRSRDIKSELGGGLLISLNWEDKIPDRLEQRTFKEE